MKERKTDRRNVYKFRPWTLTEIRILRRTYPRNGNAATKEALEKAGFYRSTDAINARARVEKIFYMSALEKSGDYVRLSVVESDICPKSGETRVSRRALRYAKRDGVAIREQVHPFTYLVPVSWADKYAIEIGEYDAEARHKLATWWRNHRVAQEFGITEDHLTSVKRLDTPLGRYIRSIPHKVYEMTGQPFRRVRLWEPTAAVRAAAGYRHWLEHSPDANVARFCKMREAIKKIRREK